MDQEWYSLVYLQVILLFFKTILNEVLGCIFIILTLHYCKLCYEFELNMLCSCSICLFKIHSLFIFDTMKITGLGPKSIQMKMY